MPSWDSSAPTDGGMYALREPDWLGVNGTPDLGARAGECRTYFGNKTAIQGFDIVSKNKHKDDVKMLEVLLFLYHKKHILPVIQGLTQFAYFRLQDDPFHFSIIITRYSANTV